MRKLLSLLVCCVLIFSCAKSKVQPIEKYKGKGIIVLSWQTNLCTNNDKQVRVKTKDSVFEIELTEFDMLNVKVGDTL